MPIRFNLPGLGRNIGPLRAHQWQLDVAYRYLHTDQFYVGSEVNDSAGPFGTGPDITVHSWEFTPNYGLTNRINLVSLRGGHSITFVCRFESSSQLGNRVR